MYLEVQPSLRFADPAPCWVRTVAPLTAVTWPVLTMSSTRSAAWDGSWMMRLERRDRRVGDVMPTGWDGGSGDHCLAHGYEYRTGRYARPYLRASGNVPWVPGDAEICQSRCKTQHEHPDPERGVGLDRRLVGQPHRLRNVRQVRSVLAPKRAGMVQRLPAGAWSTSRFARSSSTAERDRIERR